MHCEHVCFLPHFPEFSCLIFRSDVADFRGRGCVPEKIKNRLREKISETIALPEAIKSAEFLPRFNTAILNLSMKFFAKSDTPYRRVSAVFWPLLRPILTGILQLPGILLPPILPSLADGREPNLAVRKPIFMQSLEARLLRFRRIFCAALTMVFGESR